MAEDVKKYKVVNLMIWDEDEDDENVECTSLSDEYTKLVCTKDSDLYPDQNLHIGKPRYFYMTLKNIQKYVYDKENVDLFCKNNPECYGEMFNIWNTSENSLCSEMVIKYKPVR
jgi:predicted nuclease of predicted toxin-antitoxin system